MLKFVAKIRVRIRAEIPSPSKLWLYNQCHPFSHNIPKPKSYVVSYLIDSLGFTPEKALSASRHVNFETPAKPDSAIAFFKHHGFTGTQISKLVNIHPQVLTADPQKTLLPKINFLNSVGFSNEEIIRIVTLSPNILHSSIDKVVIPNFNFLATLFQSKERVFHSIKRYPRSLSYRLEGQGASNIQILMEIGVPKSYILELFCAQTRTFMTDEVKFREVVNEVKEMGFNPAKKSFLVAILTLRSMKKPLWEKKMEAYKKWGLSEDDVRSAFQRSPLLMATSEDKIDKVMDYVVNKMGFDSSILTKLPMIISYSLEKRILPRGFVYQLLSSKDLIENTDTTFVRYLSRTEMQFSDTMKLYKNEVPDLLTLYQQKLCLSN